ncbi:Uncharacterised protein [Mycobacterium tuberculosis]|nr:Uncharacterised protein [Mycobacterium tuberculosis]
MNNVATAPSTDDTSGCSLRIIATDSASPKGSDCSTNAVRPPPGPTSTNLVAPTAFSNWTPSANRTGRRACSTQYCPSP